MKRILTLALFCASLVVSAQDRPFSKEIRAFKAQDSVQYPPKKAIVFVGSSSFKMWKDVQQSFPGHVIINRGFGGSSLPHVIEYADEIVTPYKPKQIVIYCGENDFMNDTVTSEIVTNRFVELFKLLRRKARRAEIVFVSMKPSPSRERLMPEIAAANASIEKFISEQRRAKYIDIWDEMLDPQGNPRKELFLQDNLHMNAQGYAIWQKALAPHLK